jgi:3-hydroxyisobutyrate dehydrogenase
MGHVAVLGLGHMGVRMARRLVESGHEVTVWNRSAGRTVDGARVADSPASAVSDADVVITMLTDGDAVSSVLFGPSGAAPALRPGTTVVEMSTIGLEALGAIAQRLPDGVELVDAPVTGSTAAAESGSLTILAGASDATLDGVRDVLDALGTVRHCGGPGSGAALKLVLNTALVTAVASLADALSVADAVGVPRETALDALRAGPLGIAVQRLTGGTGHFAVGLALKDLDLALGAAGSSGDLPAARAAGVRMRAAIDAGHGGDDISTLIGR